MMHPPLDPIADQALSERDWDEKHALEDEAMPAIPVGLLEYEAHCAIRNLVRLYGYETARELTAGYLNAEADRSQ